MGFEGRGKEGGRGGGVKGEMRSSGMIKRNERSLEVMKVEGGM